MKKTPLYNAHIQLGAKMVEFAGFSMPIRYSGLVDEHMAVRNSVGVFDVSHMGEFIVEGEQALQLVSYISSNDPSKLEVGQAQYSCMPNENCGIVDDLITYRLNQEKYMLVVNASNIEKDWNWINDHNKWKVDLRNISEELALLAVQGPQSGQLLQALTDVPLDQIPYYSFRIGSMAGVPDIIISATGYTGSGGFELYVPAASTEVIWSAIFNNSTSIEVLPAGLGARDTLRLEMGYCLYGNDIDETTSSYEAGLGWITKPDHDFVGRQALLDQKQGGLTRRLVGFKLNEKGIPREGYEILNLDGEKIGEVTSGTQSPILNAGIGLGYLDVPFHKKGTDILIQIRKKQIPATVVRPPFVKV